MAAADPDQTILLVVDDDDANRYVIAHTLRRAGYEVREADHGAEALRVATSEPVGLVVLDIKLPDISGLEVCRRLKDDPATASVPVLHLSASLVGSDDRARGLDAGADGYLVRPVEVPELLATVRALLRIRRAERTAQLLANQWQVTFDAISDAVALLDGDGRLVRGNRALGRLLGRPFEEVVGQPLRELLRIDLPADAGDDGRVDLPVGDRWYRLGLDRLPGEGDRPGTVCILTDVTERKLMEVELRRRAEALAEADRRKDEFLAMLAHELRNPLSPALHALEALRLDGDAGAEAEVAREVALRQVRHMARMVEDLLDVSRFSQGKIVLRTQRVDLAEVVAGAVAAARPLIDAKRHALHVDLPAEPLWLDADPTRLEQVLANLLNNAAKYTDPGGRIDLAAGRRDGWAEVSVRDTGIGLAPEMLSRVFDLFTQEDRSLARTQGGLGIGLSLVRTLVELHGGQIEARSAGPGQGSEFLVRLPAAAPAEVNGARRAEPGTARPAARRRRILVVDDHVDGARILARLLTAAGHEARCVNDGQAALEAAGEFRPEVVLLDIGLPRLDGYEVARRLRARPETRGAVLVALTGYGQAEDRRRSGEAGFDHHLVKPVEMDALRDLLAGLDAPRA